MKQFGFAVFALFLVFFQGSAQKSINYSSNLDSFRNFNISGDGRLLVVTSMLEDEILIYDSITGNEVMRLPKNSFGWPFSIFYDNSSERIIIDNSNSVEVWDAKFYKRIATYEKPAMSGASAFSEVSGKVAFRDAQNFYILDLETGEREARSQVSDESLAILRPTFDITGQYVFEINGNGIHRYSVSDPEAILFIPGQNIHHIAAYENTLFVVKTLSADEAKLEFLDLQGNPKSEATVSIENYWSYGFLLQPLNDNAVFFSGYKQISLGLISGYKEDFVFEDSYSSFRFAGGMGFFLKFQDRIEIRGIEGGLVNRFSTRAFQNQSLFNINQGSGNKTQVFLEEATLHFQEAGKTMKSIPLPGAYVNQYAKGEQLFAFPTRDRKILVWDINLKEQMAEISTTPSYPQFLQILMSQKLMAAAYPDQNSIEVYDLLTGKIIQQLDLGENSPTSFDMNKDWLLVGNQKGDFATWRFSGNKLVPERPFGNLMSQAITAVKVLDNGAYIASNGRYMQVPLKKNDPLFDHAIIGHSSPIRAMSSNAVNILATSSIDGEIKLWDLQQGLLLQTFKVDSTYLNQLELQKDLSISGNGPGSYGMSFRNKALAEGIINPNPELLIQSSNTNSGGKIVFSPDGNFLATVDGSKVKIRDVKTGFLISEFTTKDNLINDIDFVKDGKSIVVATGEGLEYFDPVTGKSKKYLDMDQRKRSIHTVEISPILNVGIALNIHGWHNPIFFHTTSGSYINDLYYNPKEEIDNTLRQAEMSPDGKYVATYGSDYVKLFEVVDQNFMKLVQKAAFPRPKDVIGKFHPDFRNYVSFSQDGRYLSYVQFGEPNHTIVFDIDTEQEVLSVPGSISIFGAGNSLFMMDPLQNLQVYDIESGAFQKFQSEKEHIDLIHTLAYNTKHDLFASADTWGNIKLWNAENGQALWEIDRFASDTYVAELSPNGHFMAYSSKNGIFIFDLEQFRITELEGNNYPYFGAFSKDNNSFYYRDGEDYYVYDLENRSGEFLLSTSVPADQASGANVSPDGKYLIFMDKRSDQYLMYDLEQKAIAHKLDPKNLGEYSRFHPLYMVSGRNIFTGLGLKPTNDTIMTFQLIDYDLVTGKITTKTEKKQVELDEDFNNMGMRQNMKVNTQSQDGRWYAFQEDLHLKIEDLETNTIVYDRDFGFFELVTGVFTEYGEYLVLGLNDGLVSVISTDTFEEAYNFKAISGSIEALSAKGRFLLVKGEDDKLKVYDTQNSFKNVYTSAFMGDGDFVIANEKGFYYASKGAIEAVAFKKGSEVYPFEQYDLYYNRPDKAAEDLVDLGITDSLLAKAFYQAYQKRISRMGITEEQLSGSFNLPSVSITSKELPVIMQGSKLSFEIEAEDAVSELDRLLVWINDVPVFGSNGRAIKTGKTLEQSVNVELQEGQNKVQVAVSNDLGIESLKRTFVVNSIQPDAKPSLYLVSIGVSEYLDSNYNLNYAAKDASDLSAFTDSFSGEYESVETMTLLNREVTVENVTALKNILMKTTTNDIVIVFFAGHGVLDDNLDYYLATHNMDFENPSEKGLAYQDLESLLDGIPARQKLLLIDACHSGEIDKNNTIVKDARVLSNSDKVVANRGSVVVKSKSQKVGLENSFELMKLLFADLKRGTGAMVISSASGMEYAYEGKDWNNGVFTYALLNGLKSRKADLNADGTIKVSEIREYVIGEVQELTNGEQNPTSRKENLEFDFPVW